MTRYAVTFGLLGFSGSLLVAIVMDVSMASAVLTATVWGGLLALLGLGLGRASGALVDEMRLEESEGEKMRQVELQLEAGREAVTNYLRTARSIREGTLQSEPPTAERDPVSGEAAEVGGRASVN